MELLLYFIIKFNKIKNYITALYYAVEKGNYEIVKLLLTNKKLDINLINISFKIR